MLRWELLEIIERENILIEAIVYRPLGETSQGGDAYQLPNTSGHSARELISAVLFDGFELVSQSVVMLPDGAVQKHWTFKLQVIKS